MVALRYHHRAQKRKSRTSGISVFDRLVWLQMKFGVHHGRTLPEVGLWHIDYIYWLIEAERVSAALKHQAQIVRARLAHIRPPSDDHDAFFELVVRDGALKKVRLRAGKASDEHGIIRMEHLNVAVALQFAGHRRAAALKLIGTFLTKRYFDGVRPDAWLSARFLEDDSNFDLTCLDRHWL